MADTAITAQTVIDNSMARVMDHDKTMWSDAQALILMNKAYDYVHKLLIRIKSDIVAETETITMVAGTQEYSLSDNLPDFWGMAEHGVYFGDDPLTPITIEDAKRCGSLTTDASPTMYYLTGSNIGLVKIPTATAVSVANTLYCRYLKKNVALTLTSNMPYKNLFNEPISAFMDHLGVMKIQGQTAELTAMYNALEQSALEIASKRIPL